MSGSFALKKQRRVKVDSMYIHILVKCQVWLPPNSDMRTVGLTVRVGFVQQSLGNYYNEW